jgi:hypothetical protein
MPCVAKWQCLGETVRAPRHLGPHFFIKKRRVRRPGIPDAPAFRDEPPRKLLLSHMPCGIRDGSKDRCSTVSSLSAARKTRRSSCQPR